MKLTKEEYEITDNFLQWLYVQNIREKTKLTLIKDVEERKEKALQLEKESKAINMIARNEKRNILKAFTKILQNNEELTKRQKESLLIDLQAVLVFTQNYCFIELKSIERLLFYKIERGII